MGVEWKSRGDSREKMHWETSEEKMPRKDDIRKFDARGRRERKSKPPRRVTEPCGAFVVFSLKYNQSVFKSVHLCCRVSELLQMLNNLRDSLMDSL